jgi:hypothetical protein
MTLVRAREHIDDDQYISICVVIKFYVVIVSFLCHTKRHLPIFNK